MAQPTSSEVRWLPLESNPDVMNKYIKNLGADPQWQFVDIFGMDADLLMMVPRPVAAVMMLYPITEKSEAEKLGEAGSDSSVWFMKQTVGNACGTVGIVHALANNTEKVSLTPDGPLAGFLEKAKSLSVDERAAALGADSKIGAAHESSAREGQTEAPEASSRTNLHFVCFIHNNGKLYEMDGRQSHPTCHGNTTPDTLLEDSIEVVRKFMSRDPDQLNFTLSALSLSM